MAHLTHSAPVLSVPQRAFDGIGAFFRGLGRALTASAGQEARLRQVRHLESLSDAELAKKGIVRDRIVHHVFRDIFYI